MKSFTAKYDGRCAECGDTIQAGDILCWDIAGAAIHTDCGKPETAAVVCPVCFIAKALNGECACA